MKCIFRRVSCSSLAIVDVYTVYTQEISSKFFNLDATSFYDSLHAFNNDTGFSPYVLFSRDLENFLYTQRITYCNSTFFSLLLLFSSSEFAVYHNIAVKTGGNVR